MGMIFLRSLLDNGFEKDHIWVETKNLQKRNDLCHAYRVHPWINVNADIIFLFIKPQQLQDIDLECFHQNVLIFSILAGVSISSIKKRTHTENIIRCMPNLPIWINRWVLWYISSWEISWDQEGFLNQYIFSLWIPVRVYEEQLIDSITAIAWSGPAYFYFFTEILAHTAQQLWLSHEISLKIAKETLLWCAFYAEKIGEEMNILRESVTSKWWTTEAALKRFEKENISHIISLGVYDAYKRAQELGKFF